MLSVLPLLAVVASLHAIDVPATFGDEVDTASGRSGLPVLLPQTIRSEFGTLYPDVEASDGSYALDLGAAEHCAGATACAAAYFGASTGGSPQGKVAKREKRGNVRAANSAIRHGAR